MISAPEAMLIAAAGMLSGIVGTAGGITSLISYPALLAVGVPALPANVANIVALVACWPGSALASRPELQGKAAWLRRWAWVSAAGGAIGAALLLSTSPGAFGRVVPFLVAAGSLALLLQPRLSALRKNPDHTNTPLLLGGLLSVSAYNGYFGAGSGVMTLSLLLHTVGAKTGKLRKTPLMRVEHDGQYAIVASLGGAPKNPVWYYNVAKNPRVELQDGSVTGDYDAREVFGDEKATWWERAVAAYPDYADYQQKTERQIPLFVLTPVH